MSARRIHVVVVVADAFLFTRYCFSVPVHRSLACGEQINERERRARARWTSPRPGSATREEGENRERSYFGMYTRFIYNSYLIIHCARARPIHSLVLFARRLPALPRESWQGERNSSLSVRFVSHSSDSQLVNNISPHEHLAFVKVVILSIMFESFGGCQNV